jgi:hypothetical protein
LYRLPGGQKSRQSSPGFLGPEADWALAEEVKMAVDRLFAGVFPTLQPLFSKRLDSLRAGLDTARIDESTIREGFW